MLDCHQPPKSNGRFQKRSFLSGLTGHHRNATVSDAEVSRLDFVNWISPRTVPAIAVGNEVKENFVVEVSLKSRDFDTKAITLLAKYIPQRIVYLLRYDDEAMLATHHALNSLPPMASRRGHHFAAVRTQP